MANAKLIEYALQCAADNQAAAVPMLPNLTQLNVAQVNQALENNGYEDNQLVSVTYSEMLHHALGPMFAYDITFNDTNVGGIGKGRVFISVSRTGNICGEF